MGDNSLILVQNIDSFVKVLWDISLFLIPLMGLALLVYSLFSIASEQLKGSAQSTIGTAVKIFIAGILLINIPSVLTIFGNIIFGSGEGTNALAYATETANKAHTATINLVIHVVQLTGVIGIVKAIQMVSKPAEQGGGMGSALKIAFGASLALNIVPLLEFIARNIGGGIGTAINTVIGPGS